VPPIVLHLGVAKDVSQALPKLEILRRRAGSFYLGATAPDIRLITGTARQDTHFVDLALPEGASGVAEMFRTYPNLAQGSNLDDASRAFVAGYLSHLLTDEVWISQVYKPYFGADSNERPGERAITQMLDRALQYELDLRERDPQTMADVRKAIEEEPSTWSIPFLGGDNLAKWRDFVVNATRSQRSWDRFSQYARDFLVAQGKVTKEAVEAFLGNFGDMRERILNYVPAPELRRFREESVERSVVAIREYLE